MSVEETMEELEGKMEEMEVSTSTSTAEDEEKMDDKSHPEGESEYESYSEPESASKESGLEVEPESDSGDDGNYEFGPSPSQTAKSKTLKNIPPHSYNLATGDSIEAVLAFVARVRQAFAKQDEEEERRRQEKIRQREEQNGKYARFLFTTPHERRAKLMPKMTSGTIKRKLAEPSSSEGTRAMASSSSGGGGDLLSPPPPLQQFPVPSGTAMKGRAPKKIYWKKLKEMDLSPEERKRYGLIVRSSSKSKH